MGYRLISQLSHAELVTPTPAETLHFYRDLLGLQESHREGRSVWLRGWGEFFHHSFKITEADCEVSYIAHSAWRTDGPQELEQAAKRLEHAGVAGRWTEGDVGHGKSYEFKLPGGHVVELVWDVERFKCLPEQASVYPGRPQKQVYSNAAVRRIDHVTMFSRQPEADRDVFREGLGFRYMEGTLGKDGREMFMTLTSGAHNHDYAIIRQPPNSPLPDGTVDHTGFYYDTREELLRAVDCLAENGFLLEHGPHKHGIGELFFCYVREPGGHRCELQTGGYWNYIPDWQPVLWTDHQSANFAWYQKQMLPPASTSRGTIDRTLLGSSGVVADSDEPASAPLSDSSARTKAPQ